MNHLQALTTVTVDVKVATTCNRKQANVQERPESQQLPRGPRPRGAPKALGSLHVTLLWCFD